MTQTLQGTIELRFRSATKGYSDVVNRKECTQTAKKKIRDYVSEARLRAQIVYTDAISATDYSSDL
jgi:hypothetical protein